MAASLHTTQCASLRRLPRARPSDGVGLRRLRRRGPLLQVLPDLQGVHEKHRRQIYLCARAAAASFAPTAALAALDAIAARRPRRTTTSACTIRRSSRDGTRSRRTAPPRERVGRLGDGRGDRPSRGFIKNRCTLVLFLCLYVRRSRRAGARATSRRLRTSL